MEELIFNLFMTKQLWYLMIAFYVDKWDYLMANPYHQYSIAVNDLTDYLNYLYIQNFWYQNNHHYSPEIENY